MSAPIIGKVPYFDHTQKVWSVFQNQMEQFLFANDINDEKKEESYTSYIGLWNNVHFVTKFGESGKGGSCNYDVRDVCGCDEAAF